MQEIQPDEEPTRIASAPHFIKGVVNLRGVIVPIVDMRLKFKLESASDDSFTVVIVLNIGRCVVGMVVDAVSDVITLAAVDIESLITDSVESVDNGSKLVDDAGRSMADILAQVKCVSGRRNRTWRCSRRPRPRAVQGFVRSPIACW